MTRDQIIAKWDAMTPRERDAWVAEVVLDIRVSFEYSPRGPIYLDYNDGGRRHIRNYTTDISAAWAVVDGHARYEIGLYEGKVTAAMGVPGWYVSATTAPEAISLAALIAKLTEEHAQ
jgi:hypothetical protein